MMTSRSAILLAGALALAACQSEEPEVDTSETGGEAVGEVLGGTISDDMLPLEELTSTSPPAARQTTTTTVTEGDDGETTVETTVETVTSTGDSPQPAPPAPPPQPGAAQEGGQ